MKIINKFKKILWAIGIKKTEICPICGELLTKKQDMEGKYYICYNKKCDFSETIEYEESEFDE